jgi:hypothetical protein
MLGLSETLVPALARPGVPVLLLMSVATLAAACESTGPDASSTYLVRDSANIRIVESRAPSWGREEAWTVTPEPVLHIGVVEGPEEYRFTVIGGVGQHGGTWQQSDGTIVAADAGSRQLRRYAPDGTFLNSWGGRGDGPGEYRTLSASPYRGDSIRANDQGRYVFYDSQGNLGRTIALDLTEIDTSGERPIPIASTGFMLSFEDGTFLATRVPAFVLRTPGEVLYPVWTFFRYSPDGELMDTIGVYQAPEIRSPAEGSALLSLPFPEEFVFTADDAHVYVGSVGRFEIRRVSLTDGTESLLRAPYVDLTTTDTHRAEFRNAARFVAEANPSFADMQSVERALLEIEFPETVPAFSQLITDSEGYLWVRHYKLRGSGGTETWSVFAPEGYALGTVETPERLQVRQIGLDFIMGIWTDELEVRFVRKYGLSRGQSAP